MLPSAGGMLPSAPETPALVPTIPPAVSEPWYYTRPEEMETGNGSAAPPSRMGAAGSRTPKAASDDSDDSDDSMRMPAAWESDSSASDSSAEAVN